MRTNSAVKTWPGLALAAVLAITLSSLVLAGPEEASDWPGGVTTPGGPSAGDRLREIHDAAIEGLAGATPEELPEILRVLRASFACAAYDGSAPIGDPPPNPMPAHAPGHAGAAAKIEAAFMALHCPPAPPEKLEEWKNWQLCAEELEHEH